MRGLYSATIKLSALAAAKTLLLLTAPAGVNVRIVSASVTNSSNATNQQLECKLTRVTTIGSAAGTSITPTKDEAGDQASGCTVLGGLTVEPTYAGVDIDDQGFASLTGYFLTPMPEARPIIAGGATVGLQLKTAPTAMDTEVTMTWIEEG